ncbi:hypothetical protein KFE25_002465 [Diacronema lutheri]|uniref:Uncharacterized protein n=1 Tax=Diacronema lutheri TaxID=2081491 RepID=A0A8J5X993_DIALT|nr:hypothetical protein KFE25_002465 [Diacronema lutheri]
MAPVSAGGWGHVETESPKERGTESEHGAGGARGSCGPLCSLAGNEAAALRGDAQSVAGEPRPACADAGASPSHGCAHRASRAAVATRPRQTRALLRPAYVETAALGVRGGRAITLAACVCARSGSGDEAASSPSQLTRTVQLQRQIEELQQHSSALAAALEHTRDMLNSVETARAARQAEAIELAERLAEARRDAVALQRKLKFARDVASTSVMQSDDAAREAGALEDDARAARALLARLVTSLRALLGLPVPPAWLSLASGDPAAAVGSRQISSEDVFALERAVRHAIEGAHAQSDRLEGRVGKLAIALASAAKAARAPRQPAPTDASADADRRRAHEQLAALARREQRAQAQSVQLRLALTAAHAELEAHRQGARRGGPDAHCAATGGWMGGLSGYELVQLCPPLQPPGAADTSPPMPETLLAHPRLTSSVAVLRRVDKVRDATPALSAAASRPVTAPAGGSAENMRMPSGQLPARVITAEALRSQRERLTGELARLWAV